MQPQPAAFIQILLIHDQAVVRTGLRMLIESWPGLKVVAEAASREEALAAIPERKPDIILFDLDSSREGTGFEFLTELRSAAGEGRVLVLTSMHEADVRLRAVRHGASGVVLKEKAADELRNAIEKVHKGEIWLDRALTAHVLAELWKSSNGTKPPSEADRFDTLTARERQVATLVSEGISNDEIGRRLFISQTTVRHHLTSIFGKLGVTNRFELLIFLYRHKLVKPPG
jgi:two-component system, NarL family, nitrate/nitrite response regulator NarL